MRLTLCQPMTTRRCGYTDPKLQDLRAAVWQTYGTQRQVILSQIPLLILMVLYTVIGLWTLSLPLLVRGD
jgi:hypothetical protein